MRAPSHLGHAYLLAHLALFCAGASEEVKNRLHLRCQSFDLQVKALERVVELGDLSIHVEQGDLAAYLLQRLTVLKRASDHRMIPYSLYCRVPLFDLRREHN